jgi:hypothetical protein
MELQLPKTAKNPRGRFETKIVPRSLSTSHLSTLVEGIANRLVFHRPALSPTCFFLLRMKPPKKYGGSSARILTHVERTTEEPGAVCFVSLGLCSLDCKRLPHSGIATPWGRGMRVELRPSRIGLAYRAGFVFEISTHSPHFA